MYWGLIEQAVREGAETVDRGTSAPGSGACRFKQRFGAAPWPVSRLTDRPADLSGAAPRRSGSFARCPARSPVGWGRNSAATWRITDDRVTDRLASPPEDEGTPDGAAGPLGGMSGNLLRRHSPEFVAAWRAIYCGVYRWRSEGM